MGVIKGILIILYTLAHILVQIYTCTNVHKYTCTYTHGYRQTHSIYTYTQNCESCWWEEERTMTLPESVGVCVLRQGLGQVERPSPLTFADLTLI